MKRYPLCFVVLLALLLAACESPTGPDELPDVSQQTLPDNVKAVEHILDYSASMAKVGRNEATVTFALDDITPSVYGVRAYFEEAGSWVQMPYTLAADYCNEFIDLSYLLGYGTLTFTITPVNVRPTTRVLPPPTRIKVVVLTAVDG